MELPSVHAPVDFFSTSRVADGHYSDQDIDVMSFVANQFGRVIERHQAFDALRTSEARHRAVFERLGVRVAVEPCDVARFLTAAGERHHLEISGALFNWDGQPAMLLFAVDVTMRWQAELAQRAATERQRELNELRSRFMAMASHEFRTHWLPSPGRWSCCQAMETSWTLPRRRMCWPASGGQWTA